MSRIGRLPVAVPASVKNVSIEGNVAREALRLAMHKLPMKCRILSREGGDI